MIKPALPSIYSPDLFELGLLSINFILGQSVEPNRRGAASSGDIEVMLTQEIYASKTKKQPHLLHAVVDHLESTGFICDTVQRRQNVHGSLQAAERRR